MDKYRDTSNNSIVEAVQFDWRNEPWPEGMKHWIGTRPRDGSFGYIGDGDNRLHISHGDWIIKDAKGKFSKCSTERFEAKYVKHVQIALADPPVSSFPQDMLKQLTRIADALEASNLLNREWTDVQMQWRDEDTLNSERNYAMNMDFIQWQKQQRQEDRKLAKLQNQADQLFIVTQNALRQEHEMKIAKLQFAYQPFEYHQDEEPRD
jgi:hypothetical protein